MFKQDEVLGMSAITMDFSETYAALQNGAIDAQENPIPLCYDMKFTEVQSDITVTNHAGLDQLVIVNVQWFEGLDPEIQEIIANAVKEGGAVCKASTLEKIDNYTQIMLDAGTPKIHYLNDEQLAAWKAALEPVKEFARTSQGELGAEIFDGIIAEAKRITGE
jgi:C4-dicarboxylate-binding protein DctP